MGAFDFLKDLTTEKKVAKGVFSFLSSPKNIRDLGVSAARGVARIPETVARSSAKAGLDIGEKITGEKRDVPIFSSLAETGRVNDPTRKFLYGTDPVETYQKRREGGQKVVEGSRFRDYAAPLSFLGSALTIGGDVTGFGAGKKKVAETITEDVLKQLAKTATEAEVKKVLARKIAPEILQKIAPEIALSTDEHAIKNLVVKGGGKIEEAAKELSHITREDNLPGIVKSGKIEANAPPLKGYEGQKAAYLQRGEKNPYGFPGENNAKIIYKESSIPKHAVVNGDELAVHGGLSASPQDVARIEVSSPNLVAPLEKKGYQVVVNPDLAATQPRKLSGAAQQSSLAKNTISDIVPKLTNPTGQAANNPAENIVDALRSGGVEKLQQEQKGLYSAERSARLGKTQNVGDLTGREATYSQLSKLKGELPKVDSTALVEHLKTKVKPEDVNGILDTLRTHPNLSGYEPITAQNSIVKLFDEGKLPTESEFKILEKALGSNFTDTLKTTAIDSMSNWQKVKNFGVQVLGMPKSVMASFDLSGGARQGGVLGSRFPKIWGNAQKESVKYFASSDAYKKSLEEIASRENASIYKKMGLNLASAGGHEEQFASTLAEKIPVAGRGVAASDRAYTGGLSRLRADVADHLLGVLKQEGRELNDKELKSLGQFINTASGRGNLGSLEKHAQSLGEALFSPRLWKSRLDMLNPAYYAKLKGPARKYALQSAGSFAAIAGAVLGLAVAAGASVETDARSSDFLKIKVGDSRYDILGGFQQNLVFAWRQLSGQKKSSTTGAVTDLNSGKYGAANRLSVLSDLIRNKENPVLSAGQQILKGTDKSGNPVNPLTTIGNLFVPLNIQDTYDTAKSTGSLPKALLKSTVPGTVGIGVNTYGLKDINPTNKQKAYIKQLETKGVPKGQVDATREFYQTMKTGPDRAKASADVNKALAAGENQKAVDIANQYNKLYATTFSEWKKKYGDYTSDRVLIKDYNSGKIALTPGNIKTRVKSIKSNPLYSATTGGN